MRGFHPGQKGRAQLRQNYANGGPVRGPGTGTSDEVPDEVPEGTFIMPADSTQAIGEGNLAAMGARGFRPGGAKKVPVNLSNGEFKLPPEQVHAVGVQALEQMKNTTHTPVAQQPPTFFANGGPVEDEDKRAPISPSNIYSQAHPSADANIHAGAGMELGSSGRFAKVPEGIGHQPGRQPEPAPAAPVVQPAPPPSMVNQIPTGGDRPAAAPVAAALADTGSAGGGNVSPLDVQPSPVVAPPVAPRPASASGLYMQDRAQEIQGQWSQGQYAQALGTAARTAVQGAGIYALEAGDRLASPWLDAAKGFGRGLVGAEAAAAPAVAAPAAAPRAASAHAAAPPSTASQPGGAPAPTPDQAPPAAQQPRQVLPGVYEHGRGNYSDSAAGMGFAPGRTGQPSAQNIAAADALVGRYEQGVANQIQREQNAAAMRPGGGPVAPGSFTGGFSGVIGSDPRTAQAQRERSDLMSALTTPVAGARGLTAAQRNGALGLMKQEQDGVQASERNATALEQSRMQGQSSRDVAAMNERGANTRAAARDAIDQQRLGLDTQRYGVEARAKGFDIRAAERQEKLYERYEAAKTPEEKSAIAQQIRDLSGKATNPKDDLLTVGGGQEWDSKANVMRNVPQRIFDARTRQYVDGAPAGGRLSISENPHAIAIKNNTSMSREQKAAALAKLGY